MMIDQKLIHPVATYLLESFEAGAGDVLDHSFISAWQMACEALEALGYGRETDRGVVIFSSPIPISVRPRWDDIASVVISIAEQCMNLVHFRHDGTLAPYWGAHDANPTPNVRPGPGTGPSFASVATFHILEEMGLLKDSAWTPAAETIFWRNPPLEWELRYHDDPRFLEAVDLAVKKMPPEIEAEIMQLTTITDKDVQTHAKLQGSYPNIGRNSLEFMARIELDWIFFERWRLGDGWLSDQSKGCALSIFHDALASQIRMKVVARINPQFGSRPSAS